MKHDPLLWTNTPRGSGRGDRFVDVGHFGREKRNRRRLAAPFLCFCVGRLADLDDFALAAEDVLAAFALVEGFARHDAVDLCGSY